MKKVTHTSLSAFHHFTGRPEGLCLFVGRSCCNFLFIYLEFLQNVYLAHSSFKDPKKKIFHGFPHSMFKIDLLPKYTIFIMLRAILNKSWQQHPTRHQLYGHLPPITKTIQVRRTRHAGHCWRSRDELIRDVLLWIPTHGRAKAGRPARTYIQQLCEDTGCCPEDLPRAMNDREEWRERVRDIRAASTIWWWWWWYIYIYIYIT